MIKTQIIEAIFSTDGVEERPIGYCLMGDVSADKDEHGNPTVGIKVNGADYMVIVKSWDVQTASNWREARELGHDRSVQILIVHAVPKAPSSLIIANDRKPKIVL